MDRKKGDLILLLIGFLIIIASFANVFMSSPTGFVVFESSSEIDFDSLPTTIELKVGEEFSLFLNKPGFSFSDNTLLFDISPNGQILFTPEEKGLFRVAFIAMNENEELEIKVVRFEVR